MDQDDSFPQVADQSLGLGRRSLADLVASRIRQQILSGALAPGDRLVEEALAVSLAVSRNPVREALRQLAAEGYVEIVPRRGAAVASLGVEETNELFELRMAVEGVAARIAARKQDPVGVAKLEDVLGRARAATDSHDLDLDLIGELNTTFHAGVAEVAGNAYLQMVALPLLQRVQSVFLRTAAKRAPHSWREHVGILEAIRHGDEEAAEDAARRHVAAAQHSFLLAVATRREGTGTPPTTGPQV